MKEPDAIIGYVPGKGYSFISYSRALDESSLERIWQRAFPRGQGWGFFIGARVLKGFRIGITRMAISYIEVTTDQDELGHSGLLQASIRIMRPQEYIQCLQEELARLPKAAQDRANRESPNLSQIVLKTTRSLKTIITHPYRNVDDWNAVEALILRWILLLPGILIPIISFTTLTLSPSDESYMIAIPLSEAKEIRYRSIYFG